jgi:hypothetical protein
VGLGKTVQTIALLTLLAQKDDNGPHLIVVPSSSIHFVFFYYTIQNKLSFSFNFVCNTPLDPLSLSFSNHELVQ